MLTEAYIDEDFLDLIDHAFLQRQIDGGTLAYCWVKNAVSTLDEASEERT